MDVVLDADDLWVASELLPGVTMADELARRGAVGPEEVARWGRDVADGLAAAHGAGVLQRVVGRSRPPRIPISCWPRRPLVPSRYRSGPGS